MIAFLLLFVVLGSVIFHLLSPWWWTPIASNWGGIDATVQLTFLLTGIVFVLVLLFMIYCIVKYRYKEDRRGEYQPEDKKLEMRLTVLTTIGVIALLAPGLMVWNDYVNPPDDAIPVEVMGQQWSWSFRLPGEDGILGTSDARNINPENPFGLNPKDPNGQDDILLEGDDLHLLVDKPVKVLLRSIDVLHDFYVPQFRAKMDLVPGMITYYWFTPTREGEFEILCAELCGVGHHVMRGLVVIDNESSYQEWISEQSTFKEFQNAAKSDSNVVYVKN
ncbi:MAG: cytochrome-c oxidase [Rhodobiaceae bacterium]|jgi:cytochrome c oxidase subunit 2|nr:cytochrome-c oxidase [Rhodobiaceae bacterium]